MNLKKSAIEIWIVKPVSNFILKESAAGITLMIAAAIAMILANSPLSNFYHQLWEQHFIIGFGNFVIDKDLHHWINDGLMAVFFFVVGLELKRELIMGQLSTPKDAVLSIVAGIGGMIVPALIFLWFNGSDSNTARGWGIPMATDIAFALGVMYLLGNRVPMSLKIFLTALAIVDDLGAVLVVALFYTSNISFLSLGIGAAFMTILIVANIIGVRSVLFYGIIGIGGLWTAFLLSGVHATIAAIMAAFAIPGNTKIDREMFIRKSSMLFQNIKSSTASTNLIAKKDISNIDKLNKLSKDATPPMQRLEHSMHGFVSFFVLPVFALANAGVVLTSKSFSDFGSNLSLGIFLGLLLGKFVGIVGFSKLAVYTGLTRLPIGVTWKHIYGTSVLGAVGFTMSLFITELAFSDINLINQAKIGVISASLLAGLLGYFILWNIKNPKQ